MFISYMKVHAELLIHLVNNPWYITIHRYSNCLIQQLLVLLVAPLVLLSTLVDISYYCTTL